MCIEQRITHIHTDTSYTSDPRGKHQYILCTDIYSAEQIIINLKATLTKSLR